MSYIVFIYPLKFDNLLKCYFITIVMQLCPVQHTSRRNFASSMKNRFLAISRIEILSILKTFRYQGNPRFISAIWRSYCFWRCPREGKGYFKGQNIPLRVKFYSEGRSIGVSFRSYYRYLSCRKKSIFIILWKYRETT